MPDSRALTGTGGELLCASYLAFKGLNVYRPMTPSRRDLLIYNKRKNYFYGVQVKTQNVLKEKRKTRRYRYSFFKRGSPYSTFDVPIFCMVAADKGLMLFALNDGTVDTQMVNEKDITKEAQDESFDALMKELHYYD